MHQVQIHEQPEKVVVKLAELEEKVRFYCKHFNLDLYEQKSKL